MKKLNAWLWGGFLLALTAPVSYMMVFVWLPVTRDFPWVSLIMFAAAGVLLGIGLSRAFRQPERYRGKIFGPILTLLSVAGFAFFVYGLFILGRQMPPAEGSPRVGQKAPDLTLPDQNGKMVSLSELLRDPVAGKKPSGALLIFYRGHW